MTGFERDNDLNQRRQLAPNQTLEGYDRWAQSYDHEDNPLVTATSWVLDRMALGAANCAVLDLGCGTGRNAWRVLGEGARSYIGVDGSQGMLAIAAQHNRDPRVQFMHADLLSPWKLEEQVDLAMMVLVLEHLPTLDAIAKTLAHVVRPGGRLRIVDLHPERVASGTLAHFRDGAQDVQFASVAQNIPMLCDVLDGAGFDVVRRDWLASDSLVTAVPQLGKYQGLKVVLDIKGTRRASARGTTKQSAMNRE
ncbi:MAG: class I SAM-dependent methyltransferase [Kofleriaceae bacterium]